jgi:hypothetical protein
MEKRWERFLFTMIQKLYRDNKLTMVEERGKRKEKREKRENEKEGKMEKKEAGEKISREKM